MRAVRVRPFGVRPLRLASDQNGQALLGQRAARFARQREKPGLSAADFVKLLGVSGQSVYKWELGKARPREKQLAAIAQVRGIGKREGIKRLEMLA